MNYADDDLWYNMLGGIFGKIPLDPKEELLFPMTDITLFDGQSPKDDDFGFADKILENIRKETMEQFINNQE